MKCILFFTFLVVGLSFAKLDWKNLPEIPYVDDIPLIKEKCDENGGAGTYEKLKKAGEETYTCIKNIIDIDKIKKELESSRTTGSSDKVFEKYCRKRPQLKECGQKLLDIANKCVDDKETAALTAGTDLLENIGEFVCYQHGDRIAMFVAEGGITCISSRIDGIEQCLNETIKIYLKSSPLPHILDFKRDKQKCDDLEKLQECVVKELEDNCEDKMSANILDSLFKFVKKNYCGDIKKRRSTNLKRVVRSALAITTAQFDSEARDEVLQPPPASFNTPVVNCFNVLKQEEIATKFVECAKQTNREDKPKKISPEEFCRMKQKVPACIMEMIEGECVPDLKFERFIGAFAEALEPCEELEDETK